VQSRYGCFLERKGWYEKVLMVSAFITAIVFTVMEWPATGAVVVEVPSTTSEGEYIQVQFVRPNNAVNWLYNLLFAHCIFLGCHRVNKQLWKICLTNFDGIMILFSAGCYSLIQMWNMQVQLNSPGHVELYGESQFDWKWQLALYTQIACRIALYVTLLAVCDAIRFRRVVVFVAFGVVLWSWLFRWYKERCTNLEYAEEFLVCSSTPADHAKGVRELASGFLLQVVIFIAKNLMGRITGSTFGALRPSWKASSLRGERNDVANTVSKISSRFSRNSRQSGKKLSTSSTTEESSAPQSLGSQFDVAIGNDDVPDIALENEDQEVSV
jgi:hypothetical protein